MEIGKVIGNVIKTFVKIKTDIAGLLKESYQITPYGFVSIPIKGLYAVRGRTNDKSVVYGYVQKAIEGLNDGDVMIFAKDNTGAIKTKIILRESGVIDVESDDSINVVSGGTIDINNGNLTIEP